MATKKGRHHGQPFTCLVGNFPYGSDPSHNLPQFQVPPPNRQAITHQVLTVGDNQVSAQNHVGRMDGAIAPKIASLTVADNDFSTGAAVLTLGDFTFTAGVDYVVGGAVGATATNLAAAISTLPHYTATPSGADVDIEYTGGPADQVDFRVTYYGTITNFTPLVPATGFMDNGGPNFDAVTLI